MRFDEALSLLALLDDAAVEADECDDSERNDEVLLSVDERDSTKSPSDATSSEVPSAGSD